MSFWTRLVETIRWKLSQRKISSLKRRLVIRRRGFISGLLLAPFTPAVLSPEEIRQRILAEYLKTATGRAKLAASMIQPLMRRRYNSFAREIFKTEPKGG